MTQLEQTRRELNITQQELADFVGVSRYTIYRWETGECEPSEQNKERLQEYFQKKVQELGTELYVAKSEQPLTAKEDISTLSAETSLSVSLVPQEKNSKRKKIFKIISLVFLSLFLLLDGFFCIRSAFVLHDRSLLPPRAETTSTPTMIPIHQLTLLCGVLLLCLCIVCLILIILKICRSKIALLLAICLPIFLSPTLIPRSEFTEDAFPSIDDPSFNPLKHIELSIFCSDLTVTAFIQNNFTVLSGQIPACVELYSSSEYTTDPSQMQLVATERIDNLSTGCSISVSVEVEQNPYWIAKAYYQENDDNLIEFVTYPVYYNDDGVRRFV